MSPDLPARIHRLTPETPTIRRVVLALEDPHRVTAAPGQWIDLQVAIDGEPAVAGYSVTRAVTDERFLELAVRRSEHRLSDHLHSDAAVGDRLLVSPPQGRCVYDPTRGEDAVLVAGGVGITPLIAMARALHDAPAAAGRARLLYSARTPTELAFRGELEAMARRDPRFAVTFTVTRPQPAWPGRTGRFTAADVAAARFDHATPIYLSGPPGLIDQLADELTELAIPTSALRYERWW